MQVQLSLTQTKCLVPSSPISVPALPVRRTSHYLARKKLPALHQQCQQQQSVPTMRCVVVRAENSTQQTQNTGTTMPNTQPSQYPDWVPVCLPEELPKGVRKEVEVDGLQMMLFWYRNQIYCIQARSPAEGAYSEGFIKAKFTQDCCIECPSTGSLFSLIDGSIKSWYPNNAVLRALTPQSTCPNMEIFPVKLAQEAIYVDMSNAGRGPIYANKGGANTSLENNNVFTVQPTVYFDGMDPAEERATPLMQPNAAQATNPAIIILTVALGAAVVTVGYAIVKFASLP